MARYFILMRTILVVAAVLLWVGVGRSSSPSSSDQNLLANANFVASGRSMPTGWSVRSLPGCGFRYAVRKDGAVGEFEIINDEAVESSLQQSVHNLKPGWYLFTADIKTETVGSAGSPPELFVKSATLPIHNRAHTLGWNDDWQKLHLTFSAGSRISDVVVGFGLGTWGRPNTGKLLIRNPTLIPTTPEQFGRQSSDLEVEENPDLENLAESQYGVLYALRDEKPSDASTPPSPSVSAPASVPAPERRLSGRWTVVGVYAAFLVVAIFGWSAVSPKRSSRKSN